MAAKAPDQDMAEKAPRPAKAPRQAYCAVPGCPPSRRSDNVRFHRVPTVDSKGRPDPRREEWLRACCITDADGRGRLDICGKHFRLQDYKPNSERLFPGAVPSLNLPNPPEEEPVVQYAAEDEVVVVNIDNDDVLHDEDMEEDSAGY